MSDLITIRGPSGRRLVHRDQVVAFGPGDEGGEGADQQVIAEGIDTENPKGISSRNMSAAALRNYSACLAYNLANKQIHLANEMKSQLRDITSGSNGKNDSSHFENIKTLDKNHYTASNWCSMVISKNGMARTVGRKMYNALNNTDMYSAGLKRSIIEESFTALVEEAAPLQAMGYRDEYGLEDKTYLEGRSLLVAAIDRSSLYVGASALQSVANTQVELGLWAADARNTQTLNQIDAVAKLVANTEALFRAGETTLFKAKSETGSGNSYERPSEQFGSQAPIRPDNPEGVRPTLTTLPTQTGTSTGGEFTSTPGGVGGV